MNGRAGYAIQRTDRSNGLDPDGLDCCIYYGARRIPE